MASTDNKRLEPWDELSEKSLKKVNAIANAVHAANDTIEVNLATDILKVPGQNWACVSFVSPSSTQKCGSCGMKIRGVFDKQEEAAEYVERIIKMDPHFDVFVCELYNWCLVPPDPEKISDQTYQDQTLNTLVSEYHKNRILAKEHFEERKRELVEQANDEIKRAVLQKIAEQDQEPSQDESDQDQVHSYQDPDPELGTGSTGFVTASELMDSMQKNHCC